MITKGTNDYRKAQNLATAIEDSAMETRYSRFAGTFADMCVSDAMKLNGFASEVATTIRKRYDKCNMYFITNKQAWVLACALVEAGIDY